MRDFWAKWNLEKIDDNNYIFYGFTKKSKYKYIVPNIIKDQMDKITKIYQASTLLLAIILVPIDLLFLLPLFYLDLRA